MGPSAGGIEIHAPIVPAAHLHQTSFSDDRVVLYDRHGGRSHVLNSSAALVWDLLDGKRTLDDVVAIVHDATGVDVALLEVDVQTVIGTFRDSGLVDRPATAELSGSSFAAERWRLARLGAIDRAMADTAPLAVRAAGTTIAVRSNDVEVSADLAGILSTLPPAARAEHDIAIIERVPAGSVAASRPRFRLYVDGDLISRGSDAAGAIDTALTRVNLLAIDNTPGRILMHAGAVEREGKVVVVAGVSGRGKSTLTAALVQAGYRYVTDELVVIDPDLWSVEPFPKALDLGRGSLELLGLADDGGGPTPSPSKAPIAPSLLGEVSPGGRLVALVMLTDPSEATDGAAPEGLRALGSVEALTEVLRNTFDQTMDLPDGLDRLAEMCDRVPVLDLARTDLSDAVSTIDTAWAGWA